MKLINWEEEEKDGQREINNMYEIEKDQTNTWNCPMCGKEGKRINEVFGICWGKECMGIRTEKGVQDVRVSRMRQRKLETVLIGNINRNQGKEYQNIFHRWSRRE
jgi:hypothetical protein